MSGMLARTAVASAGALNVSFLRLCPKTRLSGHDNIADVKASFKISQKQSICITLNVVCCRTRDVGFRFILGLWTKRDTSDESI
jgi:hypothetical protein